MTKGEYIYHYIRYGEQGRGMTAEILYAYYTEHTENPIDIAKFRVLYRDWTDRLIRYLQNDVDGSLSYIMSDCYTRIHQYMFNKFNVVVVYNKDNKIIHVY